VHRSLSVLRSLDAPERVRRELSELPGVESVEIDEEGNTVEVECDPDLVTTEDLIAVIERQGVEVTEWI
jgi:copper chaperone CopZ